MKHNLRKAQLILYVLCLGIILSGIAIADDQSGETYGAYPGTPTPVSGTPIPSTPSIPSTTQSSAYQAQTVPVNPISSEQTTTVQTQTTTASGVVGAYPGMPSGTSASSTSTATAVYYTQAPPVTQQNVLLTYNIQTSPPIAVYYSGAFMPWVSFYQVFPANSPALWISTASGWSWYATCPPGSWVQELMYIPVTGTMKFYDLYSDGTTRYYNYGWTYSGYKYRWFFANAPGRYITMLTVSDSPSNYITIDVA